MRQIKKIFVWLFILTVFGSCIKEDLSDCPPEEQANVRLTFHYTGNTSDDESWFERMIDRVTLYVFDLNGVPVSGVFRQLDKPALRETTPAGVRLNLAPGNYTVICWGNAFGHTQLSSVTALSQGKVESPFYGMREMLETQDHNYYGTLQLTVPDTGEADGKVIFRGAHVNLEILIKGFTSKETVEGYPLVEVRNAMPQYTLDMREAQPYNQTYQPAVEWSDSEEANYASLQTFRFADDNPLEIVVKTRTQDRTLYTLNLKQAMRDAHITVDGLNEATVRLTLDFTDYWKDLSVKISVEGWKDENPVPEV